MQRCRCCAAVILPEMLWTEVELIAGSFGECRHCDDRRRRRGLSRRANRPEPCLVTSLNDDALLHCIKLVVSRADDVQILARVCKAIREIVHHTLVPELRVRNLRNVSTTALALQELSVDNRHFVHGILATAGMGLQAMRGLQVDEVAARTWERCIQMSLI